MSKILIYQVLPRLFGNDKDTNKENGTIEENGVGKFSAFDNKALKEIAKMGYTHIWYTGVIEHATKTDYSASGIPTDHADVVKGNAGSPYAIKDYYDVTPDLADDVDSRMAEFEALIERTHKAGLKIIMDFVPNHVARQYKSDAKPRKIVDLGANDDTSQSFVPDNNFYYIPGQQLELLKSKIEGEGAYHESPARVTGNDFFGNNPSINDWYETVKLNYGVDYSGGGNKYFTPIPDTWIKMYEILAFWASKKIDGFRCDMAEMVPVEFWNWVTIQLKSKYKSLIFIAEIYKTEEYHNYIHGGLFDYLYDKVGLYDTLRNVICGYQPTSDITFSWQRLNGLEDRMLNFIENHDEQRIASDFFAKDPVKGVPGMIVAATMNTNPVMVYFGQELGESGMDKEGFSGTDGRTTIFDYWSVDTIRRWRNDGKFGNSRLTKEEIKLRKFYTTLINLCRDEKTITDGSFFDLMYANYENPHFDPTRQYAFLRAYKKEALLIVSNFDNKDVDISVNIPQEAFGYINMRPTQIKHVTDLLANKQTALIIRENSVCLKIPANSGKIIRFSI